AGSAAYGVAEAFRWRIGLGLELFQARGFYAIVSVATMLGVALNFTPVDPIKALFGSAVINGVISVPIMIVMMLIAVRKDVMGELVISRWLRLSGWLATASMTIVVLATFATWRQ
ncbi:MAG: divalent metal cation transporter, partial [Methylomonas sp.]